MTLRLHAGRFAVCRLDPADSLTPRGAFWSMTRTASELSVVCEESAAAGVVEMEWRMLEVAGPLAFEMTGVMASIAEPLANASVSIFVVSTFDTDYVLVKASDLTLAVDALCMAGHLCQNFTDD